jgi:hypothetical protein
MMGTAPIRTLRIDNGVFVFMVVKYSLQHNVVKNYFIRMNQERLEQQLNDLKKQISTLGMAIPGSIQTAYPRFYSNRLSPVRQEKLPLPTR